MIALTLNLLESGQWKHSKGRLALAALVIVLSGAMQVMLGNVAENKNFPTVSPRSIYEFI